LDIYFCPFLKILDILCKKGCLTAYLFFMVRSPKK
jgi:hypothetical protein